MSFDINFTRQGFENTCSIAGLAFRKHSHVNQDCAIPDTSGVTCCLDISVYCILLVYLQCYYGMYKVRKTAKIRNQYNQESHLSQDTKWESKKITINITNKSQEASPFPPGDHKAAINEQTQKHDKHKT